MGEYVSDIFAACYEVLVYISDRIVDKYHSGNEDEIVEELDLLLRTTESEFEEDLESKLQDLSLSNIAECKRIMFLIAASKSFLLTNYDIVHDIDKEAASKMFNKLRGLSSSELLEEIKNDSVLRIGILEDFIDYINRPYIFQNQSKELAFTKKLLPILLKLNPYEILDINDYIPSNKFIDSEIMIQMFLDVYEKSLAYSIRDCEEGYEDEPEEYFDCCEDPEDDFSEEYYDEQDKQLVAVFLNNLREALGNDENRVCNFIHYILGNIYESLMVYQDANDKDAKKYFRLIRELEDTQVTDLINAFLTDYRFTLLIIDCFIFCNDSLGESDLIIRREAFKRFGNVPKLQRLNPQYFAEELVFVVANKKD